MQASLETVNLEVDLLETVEAQRLVHGIIIYCYLGLKEEFQIKSPPWVKGGLNFHCDGKLK